MGLEGSLHVLYNEALVADEYTLKRERGFPMDIRTPDQEPEGEVVLHLNLPVSCPRILKKHQGLDLKSAIVIESDGTLKLSFSKMAIDFVPPEALSGGRCDLLRGGNRHRELAHWSPHGSGIRARHLLPYDRIEVRARVPLYPVLFHASLCGNVKIYWIDSCLHKKLTESKRTVDVA